mmetsp:Transcript_42203/g.112642  ORF Transcript_42203/g.112642 Transcript_42203/m.112642 type:complete len:458 (-) Transcript_42203:32-1405(-)
MPMAPLRRTLLALLALAPWAVVPTASFVRPSRGLKAPLRSIRGGGGGRPSTAMAAAGGADEAMMERLRAILLKGQATGGAAPAAAAATATATTAATTAAPAPAASDGAWDIELCSPSKVNLFLRITARRDDGYHDLASLFQAISLSDKLSISKLPDGATDDVFECDMEGVPNDRTNLVLQAVDCFRENTGSSQFFKLRLEKTVPAQAGLGGGSGNAATALYGCNELCGRPGTAAQLEEWSKVLGSDATFFMSQGTAYCTGRGEILEPMAPLEAPPSSLYIVKPEVGLSTPAVFKALASSEWANGGVDTRSTMDPKALLGMHVDPSDTSIEKYVNDLEPPAFECLPDLKALKERLLGYGFDAVMMSGSGTSLFCTGEPNVEGWPEVVTEDASLPWPVRVFKTSFLNRPADSWYEAAGAGEVTKVATTKPEASTKEAPKKKVAPKKKGGSKKKKKPKKK